MDQNNFSLEKKVDISTDKIREFRKKGHVLTENLLNKKEVDFYCKAITDTVEKLNTEKRKIEERDTYGKAFLQIHNLWQHDLKVRNFVLAKRFGKIAADLLGVKKVRLYHDQALFKEPGGGPTPWHQDQYYWPIDTPNTVTMWMPLVDIDESMGMLTFASNSHKDGVIKDLSISDESNAALSEYVRDKKYPISNAKTMNAGDATWHYGFTIHNAPGNNSIDMRKVMTIIFMEDGAKVTAPKHEAQAWDHKMWLRAIEPGSLAATDLNPIIQ